MPRLGGVAALVCALAACSAASAPLEGVTGSRAEPVVLRAPYLLPALAPLQTAALAGTSFTVAGVAALEVPGGALVVEGDLQAAEPR